MKKKLLAALLSLMTFIGYAQNNGKAEIESVNKKYTTAVEQGDTVVLKQLFDDDMVVTGPMGRQRDKKAEIADAVVPGINVYFFKMENEAIRVFGSTAITTGMLVWKINSNGSDRDFKMVFTFAYAKIGKDWKIVAQHIGRAPM